VPVSASALAVSAAPAVAGGPVVPATSRAVEAPAWASGAPAAVYLLLHATEHRFKLGWSSDPQRRALELPEYRWGALDLHGSLVAWLDSRSWAEQVERSMHKLLRSSAVPAPHDGDGRSEWFDTRAWERAVALLQQVPADAQGVRLVRLQPFTSRSETAALADPYVAGDAQSAWLRIEALLLQMARHSAVALLPTSAPLLRFVGLRRAWQVDPFPVRVPIDDSDRSIDLAALRRALSRSLLNRDR
jgi:hypothetical protein